MNVNYLSVGAQYGCELESGLLGYWNLDQNSDTLTDSLGINNATNTGGVVYQTGILGGKGVTFDTASDYITISTGTSTLYIPNSKLSVSMWVNFSSLPATELRYYTLFSTQSSGEAYSFSLLAPYDGASSYIRITTNDSIGNISYETGYTYITTTGIWYHIVGILRGDGLPAKIYINGVDRTDAGEQRGTRGSVTLNNGYTRIGNYYTASNGAPLATIDEVGMWGRALSSTEVTALYNGGTGLTYPFH